VPLPHKPGAGIGERLRRLIPNLTWRIGYGLT
jgi:hypothetical protein